MFFPRSIHFATAILSITSTALAIRVQPRHDGRSHQGAHDAAAAPQLRQRQVNNGPAVGIQPQSEPGTAVLPVSTPTDTFLGSASGTLTLTSTLPFDYESSSSPPTTLPHITAAPPTSEANPYIFPSSIVQVPVATICPDSPPIFPNATTVGSGFINATALLPNGSSTVYLSSSHPSPTNVGSNSLDPSNYTPVPLPSPISISVCDPDTDPSCPSDSDSTTEENTSVFSPTPIPLPSARNSNGTGGDGDAAEERVIPDPTARILLDGNGCQTIYSPSYTAVCKTTVKMVGMPEVTVTECGQWVTFSSDVGGCYGEAVVTGSVGAGGVAGSARDDDGDDGYRGSTTGISTTAPGITPSAGATLPTMTVTVQPGTYYAAHWVDVARGGVPANVRVEECQGAPVTCQTFKERWSESKTTGVVVQESVASFEGPAILTTDSSTITTTLSFSSTVTKTVTTVSATVVRERLGGEAAAMSTSESSVVASETAQEVPPQVTIQLVKVSVPAAEAAPKTAIMMESASAPASASAVQSQSLGVGRDGQEEKEMGAEDVGEDGSGSGSGDVELQEEEGDGNEAEADVGDEGEGEGEGEKEEPQDGVLTTTVEETHTSTHLVFETRTMAR